MKANLQKVQETETEYGFLIIMMKTAIGMKANIKMTGKMDLECTGGKMELPMRVNF